MHILELTKPDGRHLTLDSSRPLAPDLPATIPVRQPPGEQAQLLAPYRTRDRLKVAGGAEFDASIFVFDVLPEATACTLQQVTADLEQA